MMTFSGTYIDCEGSTGVMGGGEGSVVAGLDGNERGMEPREDDGDCGLGDTSRVLPPNVASSSSSTRANSESCVGSRFALNDVPSRVCAWCSSIEGVRSVSETPKCWLREACEALAKHQESALTRTLFARALSVSATCTNRSYA